MKKSLIHLCFSFPGLSRWMSFLLCSFIPRFETDVLCVRITCYIIHFSWIILEPEGDQNMPPPNMPLWHKGYFEQKASDAVKFLCPLLICQKAGHWFFFEEGVPLYQDKETDSYLWRWGWGLVTLRWICINRLYYNNTSLAIDFLIYFLVIFPQFITPKSPNPLSFS